MVAARKKTVSTPDSNRDSSGRDSNGRDSSSDERTRLQLMLGQQDRERIEDLRRKYDVAGGSDILRLAINLLASDIGGGKEPRKFVYEPDPTPRSMTTLWINERSRDAIKLIQEHYGMESLADSVRFALVRLHRMWMGAPDVNHN